STQMVRRFSFIVDEPAKLGGGDHGPTPLEYVLGAYNGCLQIVIVMIARELSIEVRDLAIESVATVDRRGLFGTAAVSPHFQSIETEIVLTAAGESGLLEQLKERLYARCPMYNLIKDAGVRQEIRWHAQGNGSG
ncbi:MAG: OsmC family protein, partial [bacterium]|nr:OsmC family protein [bacterium]